MCGCPPAAAAGTQKIRARMDAAVTMATVAGNARVDWALGHAAVNGRFGYQDLASILNAHPPVTTRQATESRSLTQGTHSWARIGTTRIGVTGNPAATEASEVTE
jgi:hypothetical protein